MTVTSNILFRRLFFLYSLCPNLEGIKDAPCYKFRSPTIGQNCAVCTSEGAIEMHSRMNGAKHRVFWEACSAGHQASSEAGDQQSEKVAIAVVSLSSCCWPVSRGVVYEVVGLKLVLLHANANANGWHTARERFSEYVSLLWTTYAY